MRNYGTGIVDCLYRMLSFAIFERSFSEGLVMQSVAPIEVITV
ncbi:MAG: hypothetical protein PSN04_11090 [Methyloprofundus sp.]|nr:hypothetical protein [Methyloprofundus sp.]